MALPKITIVTPSFNQGHYLEATFQSVLEQDYPNIEWLVVDGGSKDNSVDLIRKYEKHFAWWISEKDRNHPHALNKGYERATGDIFCFVNSDDLLDKGALHYVAKQFVEKPGTEWVVGWARYFQDDGEEWPYDSKACGRDIDWFVSNPVPQISSFWSTSAFKRVGPFTEKYLWAFDYEYWVRMWFVGKMKPLRVRRCLGSFRLHSASKTVSKPQNYGPDFAGIHAEYEKYLTPEQKREMHKLVDAKQSAKDLLAGWEALNAKDIKTARELAKSSWQKNRFSPAALRLMYCAMRGH